MQKTVSLINIANQSKTKAGIRGDRASVLGNPFDMGKDEGLRDRVCDAYDDYVKSVLDGEKYLCPVVQVKYSISEQNAAIPVFGEAGRGRIAGS